MSDYGSVTQCPKCSTSFHVGPAQLEAAKGRVRCGGCLSVFVAKDHFVVEQKPLFDTEARDNSDEQKEAEVDDYIEEEVFFNTRAEDDQDILPSQSKQWAFSDDLQEPETSELDEPVEASISEPSEEFTEELPDTEELPEEFSEEPYEEPNIEVSEKAPEEIPDETGTTSDFLPTRDKQEDEHLDEEDWITLIPERSGSSAEEPDFSHKLSSDEEKEAEENQITEALFLENPSKKRYFQLDAKWSAVAVLLLLGLFLQSVYWQPASMRTLNIYNRISDKLCNQMPCRSVVLQDLSQLQVSGIVRPSSQYENALSVQVELRNLAQDYQYFPHIELAFTDLQGETISLRRFAPGEYLRAETAGRTQIAPFQPVQIEFELYDPGASAISYAFNLLYLN